VHRPQTGHRFQLRENLFCDDEIELLARNEPLAISHQNRLLAFKWDSTFIEFKPECSVIDALLEPGAELPMNGDRASNYRRNDLLQLGREIRVLG
jgi:hypothetical protein